MSLWDTFKTTDAPGFEGRRLLECFTELDRGSVRLGVAGKIYKAADVRAVLDAGVDFVLLGRAAILHHDYPQRMAQNPDFEPIGLPVTRDYLRAEGLGDTFVQYMHNWPGFVQD